MKANSCLGTRTRPSLWWAVGWVAVSSYGMSAVFLGIFLNAGGFRADPYPVGRVLLISLIPTILSTLAAVRGSRSTTVMKAFGKTLLWSLGASLLCAPLTFVVYSLSGVPLRIDDVLEVISMLLMVSVIGAMYATPLGVSFGVIFGLAVAWVVGMRNRPSRSSIDLSALALGAAWIAIGVVSTWIIDESSPKIASSLKVLTQGLQFMGFLVVLVSGVRAWMRRRVVSRAHQRADWAIRSKDVVEGAETLPRLFAFGRADGVLLRRRTTVVGPYRSSENYTPIALVPLKRTFLPAGVRDKR